MLLLMLAFTNVGQAQRYEVEYAPRFRREMRGMLKQARKDARPRTMGTDSLLSLFAEPPMELRPFVRWWWNGDKVRPDELCRELSLLHEAGVGGVEINPIEFPWRCDSVGEKSLHWLGEQWLEALDVTLKEARRLDMQCDLLVGSGWPFGCEDLPMEERAQVMLTLAVEVEGGRPFMMLKDDVYKAVDPQVTTSNPDRRFELVSLTLTPDTIGALEDAKDVTGQCVGDTIRLALPKGKYVLYCLVRCQSFASVINGAPGASGPILDHLNALAVERYLGRMSTTLEARLGPAKNYLRAYFVDSMELEGCNWTSDFAQEFRKRRGYDIMPYLPLISFQVGRLGEVRSYQYGAIKTPEFGRQLENVRRDFEMTKAELFQERYTEVFLDWCHRQGVKARAQAYGRGFFPLESSLGYDIPEGESWTTNYLRHRVGEEMPDEDYRRGRAYTMISKYVASAAHIMGRRMVSAEEMTNTYRVFHTSLELLKLGSDMSSMAGTTHSVWHGFNYSPPEAGFPGWVQYGSYYSEQNTWWPYFQLLNDYRARTSVLLNHGVQQSSVAILLPTEQLWGECGVQTEPFPNYPRGSRYEVPQLLWEAVHKCGGNADLVSCSLLDASSIDGTGVQSGTAHYEVVLVMEDDSLGMLLPIVRRLEKKGKVVRVPNLESRDYLDWYAEVQRRLSLPHDVDVLHPDRFLMQNHLRLDDGSDLFHLVNCHIDQSIVDTLVFPSEIWKGKTCWLYDAQEGVRRRLSSEGGVVAVRLGPAESWLMVWGEDDPENDNDYRPLLPLKGGLCLDSCWNVVLRHAATGRCDTLRGQSLRDLKEDSLYSSFMGTITYSTTLEVRDMATPTLLDLGKVCDISRLRVNGEDCGVKWFGERIYDVKELFRPGTNWIEIEVTTLMGNYMRTMEDNKVVQNFVIKRNVPEVSLGLLGPVRVQ